MSKDSGQECTSLYYDYIFTLQSRVKVFLGLLYPIHVRTEMKAEFTFCHSDVSEILRKNEILASLQRISIWKLIQLMVSFLFVCLFHVFKGIKLQLYAFLKYQEMYLVLLPFFFYSARIDLTVIQTRNSSRAETVSMSPLLLSTMGYWCTVNK